VDDRLAVLPNELAATDDERAIHLAGAQHDLGELSSCEGRALLFAGVTRATFKRDHHGDGARRSVSLHTD